MNQPATEFRLLNELDHVRIDRLLRGNRSIGETLTDLLDDADVVSPNQIPDDVITMYTRVIVEDIAEGTQRTLTVCYPEDADPAAGFVSVLSPIGTALLGRRRGDETQWTTPSGTIQRLRVGDVLFQPEANGDYTR